MIAYFVLPGRRSAYNWLTGSSVDTLADYSLSSDSLSSLLVFEKKRAERPLGFRAVGPGFGSRRLVAPADETDSRSAGLFGIIEGVYYGKQTELYTNIAEVVL